MSGPKFLRFYFHIAGDGQDFRDDEGEVFASVEAAREHAARVAYELRHDGYRGCSVCVIDTAGAEVARVLIGDGKR